MILSVCAARSALEAGICGVLEGGIPDSPGMEPLKFEEAVHSDGIQNVSWSEMSTTQATTPTNTAGVSLPPQHRVTRDDAPPSYLVVSGLIGFAILSLILGLMSLPHHWFHGDTLTWRERKKW